MQLDPAHLFELLVFVILLPIIARGWAEFLAELHRPHGKIWVKDWRTGERE